MEKISKPQNRLESVDSEIRGSRRARVIGGIAAIAVVAIGGSGWGFNRMGADTAEVGEASSVDSEALDYGYLPIANMSLSEIVSGDQPAYVYQVETSAIPESEPKPEPEPEAEPPKEPEAEPEPEEKPKDPEPVKEPKPEKKEAPKEMSTLEAAKKFSESDHKYAKCGAIVYGYIEAGYSYEQALGVAGNGVVESVDCNPRQHQQPSGPGRGIFQWTKGDRWEGVVRLANERGVSRYDMNVQIDYSLWELNNTESRAKGMLKDANTVNEAAKAFCNGYERPNPKYAHIDRRQDAANEIKAEIDKIKNG